ncbi:dihydrofolate reductase [Neptunomonas phycophila]|jgi:dihydrofolate reductase|uniref:Dihydrofolate reductase n=1 Tax=Neptunomonas phycophila TaxID=1572645 RepID=A0AAW7XJK8_9GAMM|nr:MULTISPECIES: dihydrofolate reductase [Neptunomonas]MBT3145513.1 dihydrofolate reductase [Neptunomonas phycophila]MDN2659998.1 dihydrofolate reductase [Neptunomonas sp. CHC150]MDO6453030.1 dihydrofolate reductase [Neptunomonas phycophila]MDO6469131.1 dihydrofolate reductase [Neptunomonas phycophila]MDO6784536.1 dihydrofolate reductase [Neptunomonas phycophila]
MRLAMIVAQSSNRVIGRDNKLPWYLPGDLKYFKQATMGKPIIMGRKTFESIGKPLPGRLNIVISRDASFTAQGIKVVMSLPEAIELAESQALIDGVDEAMIIGGAQIYALALPEVERLYITQVHADIEGDAYFPEFNRSQWTELGREDFSAQGPNPYDYSFIVYQRSK